jgi:V/A-type H+-transporting ATPase subunit E
MAQQEHPKPSGTSNSVAESGVDTLISRLRDTGIAEGRAQADAIVKAAQQQAGDIVAKAKREADGILQNAGEETRKLKVAGEDAIRLAMRDTIIAMEGELTDNFQNMLRRLVNGTLSDPDFLQRLILEVAGKVSSAVSVERKNILLPAEIISLEELRRNPEEAKPGTLMHFVVSLGEGMLQRGLTFGVTEDVPAGIRVQLVDKQMQVDLTDAAISQLLLRHLLPRFRALLRSAVVSVATTPKRPSPVDKGLAA